MSKPYRCHVVWIMAFSICMQSTAWGVEQFKKEGFTITLPEGWIEIPKNVVVATENETKQRLPTLSQTHTDCAFQLKRSENWFTYPYILVETKNIGHIPESMLEGMEGQSFQSVFDKDNEALRGLVPSGVQAEKIHYDRNTRRGYFWTKADVVGMGRVSSLCGIVPTEKGLITVSCFSLGNEFPRYEEDFQKAIESVKPLGVILPESSVAVVLFLLVAIWLGRVHYVGRRQLNARLYAERVAKEYRDSKKGREEKSTQFENEQQRSQERQHRQGDSHENESREISNEDWCYRLLGVTPGATLEEINRAYRQKAKMHHPDHKGDGDVMRMLNEAVQILRELHAAK